MIAMKLFLEADGMFEGKDPAKMIVAQKTMSIGVLREGMESGLPSIAMGFELPDGSFDAFRARYGDGWKI